MAINYASSFGGEEKGYLKLVNPESKEGTALEIEWRMGVFYTAFTFQRRRTWWGKMFPFLNGGWRWTGCGYRDSNTTGYVSTADNESKGSVKWTKVRGSEKRGGEFGEECHRYLKDHPKASLEQLLDQLRRRGLLGSNSPAGEVTVAASKLDTA